MSNSVPAFVVALIDPEFQAWENVGIAVGNSVEADVDALNREGGELGERCLAYWNRCRSFWDSVASGRTGMSGLAVQRELLEVRQSDSSEGREDLTTEFEALRASSLGDVVEAVTAANVDWVAIANHPCVKSVDASGDTTQVVLNYQGRNEWPRELGGTYSRGETARLFTLTLNHAKWRDRRVRRLVSLNVESVEIWPETV